MNPRRLYRCRHDRSLAGVASGMAEYLDVDPTVVRVLWILATLLSGGLALLLYVILAFVMPNEPYAAPAAGGPTTYGPTAYGPTTWGQGAPAEAAGTEGAGGDATGAGTSGTGTPGEPAPSGWTTAPAWGQGYPPAPRARSDGRLGLAFGVLLIVFGSLALAGPLFPGWITGIALGPAFLVALGIAFVVISARRPASES